MFLTCGIGKQYGLLVCRPSYTNRFVVATGSSSRRTQCGSRSNQLHNTFSLTEIEISKDQYRAIVSLQASRSSQSRATFAKGAFITNAVQISGLTWLLFLAFVFQESLKSLEPYLKLGRAQHTLESLLDVLPSAHRPVEMLACLSQNISGSFRKVVFSSPLTSEARIVPWLRAQLSMLAVSSLVAANTLSPSTH
jgi:hypothetical protein